MMKQHPETHMLAIEALSVLELDDNESFNELFESHQDVLSDFISLSRTPKLSFASLKTQSYVDSSKVHKCNRKDDFDYNKYIKEELKKLRADDIDPQARKQLIQKIRNRMSAQRSRHRNKVTLVNLQTENSYLKAQNAELMRKINVLREENEISRRNSAPESYNNQSDRTIESDISHKEKRYRDTSTSVAFPYKNILFVSCILLAVALAPRESPGQIKMAGVVPLLTSNPGVQEKELQTLKKICQGYCVNITGEHKPNEIESKELRIYREDDRLIQLYGQNHLKTDLVSLSCKESSSVDKRYALLMSRTNLDSKIKPGHVIFVPNLVHVKPGISPEIN